MCHFCRGLDWCVPPPKGTKLSGCAEPAQPQAEAGEEDIDEAGLTAEDVAGEIEAQVKEWLEKGKEKEAASEVAHNRSADCWL